MKRSLAIPLKVLLIVGVILLAIRLALPHIVLNTINNGLEDMSNYHGEVENIDLAIWRGAYRIHNLVIQKRGEKQHVPFLKTPQIDISISWTALIRQRMFAVNATVHDLELNLIDSETEGEKQFGEDVDWRVAVQDFFQFDIDELHFENATVAFRNFNSDPEVNVYARDIYVSVYSLTNVEKQEGKRTARIEGTGEFLNHAPMELAVNFDPFVDMEDFDFRFRVSDVDLTQLNDFVSAYAKFDFEEGKGNLVIEAEARNHELTGYIKPLLRNVEIFDLQAQMNDEEKGFLRGVWEAFLHITEKILQNPGEDQLASRIEVSGNLNDPDISPFQAFLAILRNGFIEAFSAQFEWQMPEPEDDDDQ